jgi:UDP-2,4-diacetamido-2,4,6-trideoxy-beta-L-altropyranose hydrolase
MMDGATLVIRADANTGIGIGHVMRCLALAQAWQDAGGRVVFALAIGIEDVGGRLRSEGMETASISAQPGSAEDAARTAELCQRRGATWLVLDGFHFAQPYRDQVGGGIRLLLFDDHGEFGPYRCDVVLNTNPYASVEMYPDRDEKVCFLLGPQYALLRREFLSEHQDKAGVPEQAGRILVTFGGADANNVTLLVLEALARLQDLKLETVIVVGASSPHLSTLETAARNYPGMRVVFNPDNMPRLMARAELAISAGGGTCYELAFLQVPMFLLTIAQNHERTVETWGKCKAAIDAEWFDRWESQPLAAKLRQVISNKFLRKELADNAAALVDGRGAGRVVAAMQKLSAEFER